MATSTDYDDDLQFSTASTMTIENAHVPRPSIYPLLDPKYTLFEGARRVLVSLRRQWSEL